MTSTSYFRTGPHIIDQLDTSTSVNKAWSDYVAANSSGVGHRAWWVARDPNPATQNPGGFEGLEESLKFIGDLLRKTGPVHGIWGFSQGACFAGMLVALLGENSKHHLYRPLLPQNQGPPAAGIFFSGFKSRFQQYDEIYARGITGPTMHVMGEKDAAVSVMRRI